jgi:hypothetical protein
MKATTPLTEEMILEQFTDSLGVILIFDQEKGAWEELFELIEPKKFTEDGGIESTGIKALSEEEKRDLKIGANNFAAEMKALYPDIFAETMRLVNEAQKVYEEVRDIIRANAEDMAPDVELALAHIAGGPALKQAVHTLEFPPCSEDGKCAECWVNKWCVHTKTPVGIRMALIGALGVFTTPNLKINDKIVGKIKTYNKTDPTDVKAILQIARHYGTKIEEAKKQEAAKDDQAEDSQGDKPDQDSV